LEKRKKSRKGPKRKKGKEKCSWKNGIVVVVPVRKQRRRKKSGENRGKKRRKEKVDLFTGARVPKKNQKGCDSL